MNTGHVRDVVRRESSTHVELGFRHEPEMAQGLPFDPSHSGIYGVPEDDIAIPEMIVTAIRDIR
jgi:hypothetical protein